MSKIFKNKTIAILSAALAVVLVAIGVMLVMELSKPKEMIDLSNLTEQEVVSWYKKDFKDSKNLLIENKYDEKIEAKKLISQSIKAGKEIDKDTKIKVVFSKGPDPKIEIALPNFVEEKFNKTKIEKFFTDNKFLDVTYEYVVSEEPLDTVIKVNVSDKAKRSDVIVVTLSVGDKVENITVSVPDLKTFTLNNAKSWASGNAITLNVNEVFDDSSKGTILSQSISANTTIKGGSSIDIEVSRGPEVVMKNLTGMTWNEASNWANKNNLNIYYTESYSSSVGKGKIISQSPYSGNSVEEGTSVEVVLSLGINPKTVKVSIENKSGVSETDFKNYISKITKDGFSLGSPKKLSGKYSDSIAADLVVWNTTGTISITDTVEYYLSLGAYNLDAANFEGKTVSAVENVISSENDKGAGVSFDIVSASYTDKANDTVYACKVDGKRLVCNKSLGSYVFDASKFEGGTVDNANAVVAQENNLGANISFNVSGEEYNNSFAAGKLFACEYSGNAVSCKKSLGKEPTMVSIVNNVDVYRGKGDSYQSTVDNIYAKLGAFGSNLTIVPIENDPDKRTPGVIDSIYVDDKKDFKSKEYDADKTKVVFYVVKS